MSDSDFAASWRSIPEVPDEHRAEAWRLAAEMRRIIELLTLVDAPAEELARAADAAHTFAERRYNALPVVDANDRLLAEVGEDVSHV